MDFNFEAILKAVERTVARVFGIQKSEKTKKKKRIRLSKFKNKILKMAGRQTDQESR